MTDLDDEMSGRTAQLAEVYRQDLQLLAERSGVRGRIVETGGGCTAIELMVGKVLGTDRSLELLITTIDAGLAADRSEILHWYACVYDAEEGGDALADGHDMRSSEVAYSRALENLRQGVSPIDEVCRCVLAVVDDSR